MSDWIEILADKLFTPERIGVILKAYVERSADADSHRRKQLQQARRALTETQAKITRLLGLVEEGVVEASDPDLKHRFETARQARKDADDRVRLLQAAGSRQSATRSPNSRGPTAARAKAASRETLP